MIRFSISLILLLVFMTTGLSSGIPFFEGNWKEALVKAKEENKAIFVDVFTDWCLPCKKMDKNVFGDESLGNHFNEYFISIKINAEDNSWGEQFSDKYDIKAFPALLFFGPDEELLIRKTGFHSISELLMLKNDVIRIRDQYELILSYSVPEDKEYTLDELTEVLSISQNYSFDNKIRLIIQYLDLKELINESDLRLVMGEVENFNIDLLKRIAPITIGLSDAEIAVRRNPKERKKWKMDTESSIMNKIQQSTSSGNYDQFVQSVEVLKSIRNINKKEVDWFYFNFYRSSDLEKYKTFATYMISEYIVPATPEEVKKTDLSKYSLLNSHEMNVMAEQFFGDKMMLEDGMSEEDVSLTPTLDSIAEINTIGKSIADKLYDISSDFFAFFDDTSSLTKAEKWAALAYEYYPFDLKYFENHITILYSIGAVDRINEVKEKYEGYDYYDEMKIKKEQSNRVMIFSRE